MHRGHRLAKQTTGKKLDFGKVDFAMVAFRGGIKWWNFTQVRHNTGTIVY